MFYLPHCRLLVCSVFFLGGGAIHNLYVFPFLLEGYVRRRFTFLLNGSRHLGRRLLLQSSFSDRIPMGVEPGDDIFARNFRRQLPEVLVGQGSLEPRPGQLREPPKGQRGWKAGKTTRTRFPCKKNMISEINAWRCVKKPSSEATVKKLSLIHI